MIFAWENRESQGIANNYQMKENQREKNIDQTETGHSAYGGIFLRVKSLKCNGWENNTYRLQHKKAAVFYICLLDKISTCNYFILWTNS